MIDTPSITKFAAFVELKSRKAPPCDRNFRGPTKQEYVRYVRRLGDHFRCDPETRSKWERLLALLDWRTSPAVAPVPVPPPKCPACGKPMFLLGTLPRAPNGWRVTVKA